ncbi:MAG: DNA adenine methylase [Chloroflexi bacterium]|nr:DNA adenine methylase [Chloroflexota bacterium]
MRVRASPFVKWAGGKTQLLIPYAPLFPPTFNRYYEPFLGGGAVFFFLQPPNSFLSDTNEELINAYWVVRDWVEPLIESLRRHVNDRDYYYFIRAQDPAKMTHIERASRLIFLNKTCYNGLYRVNRDGRFNVPFGRYRNPKICDEEGLRAASMALQGTHLRVADFADAVADAQAGDFVYLDPPYHPLNSTSSFTSYAMDDFKESDQRRLAEVYRELDRRGCLLMLSNSYTPLILDLYRGFRIEIVEARRAISSVGHKRGPVREVVVLNYEGGRYAKNTGPSVGEDLRS